MGRRPCSAAGPASWQRKGPPHLPVAVRATPPQARVERHVTNGTGKTTAAIFADRAGLRVLAT
eukprot:363990-Chlamydomonas_euryale.AAC.1